jgi:uncharacterized protein YkwD
MGENISYGFQLATNIVMNLFIDDGVSSRGHRTNMMHTSFRFTGIYTCEHSNHRTMTVFSYADNFDDFIQDDDTF